MENTELLHLDPSEILAEGNSRYGLKKLRIEAMVASILAAGGIQTPVEVEPLHPPVDGMAYRLTAGFYRHAGAVAVNANGGNVLIPAIPFKPGTAVERLKRQLRENMDRENQSPMDKAVAISKLMEEGVSKLEIRKTFAMPGGRKGLSMQPASNAWVNMVLSFLDFPKNIQTKIHDGTLPVSAAYELTKVHKDKYEEVLEKAETARQKEIDVAEKDEEKFLSSTKKAAEAEQKAEKAADELKAAESLAAEAEKTRLAKLDESAKALIAKGEKGLSKEEKDKREAAYKKLESEAREAEKVSTAADKSLAKLSGKATSATADAKEKLAAARAAADLKKKGAAGASAGKSTGKTIKQAAQDTPGAQKGTPKPTPMNATEMRSTVDTLSKPGSRAKVQKIGEVLKACFAGEFPASQLGKKLGEVTGEK